MAKNAKTDINITRTFNAPADRVFKAWTDPEQTKKWWGPIPFTAPSCEIDLRVGGKYLFCMRSPEGQDFWSAGVYREIVPNKRLVVTDYFSDEHGNKVDPSTFGLPPGVPAESVVKVTFEEHGKKTTLTIHYDTETQAAHDALIKARMVDGWNSSLDKLAALVE